MEATLGGRKSRYLLCNQAASYGGELVRQVRRLGIQTLLSPVQAPRANAVAERDIRTLRNERLDPRIILAVLQHGPSPPEPTARGAPACRASCGRSGPREARPRWPAPVYERAG